MRVLTITIFILCIACNNNTESNNNNSTYNTNKHSVELDVDTENIEAPPPEKILTTTAKVSITDSADYSKQFINSFIKQNSKMYKQIKLAGRSITFDSGYTALFPEVPVMKQYISFTGIKDKLAIAVSVERVNQSTIDYKIEMVEFGKAKYISKGQAHLSPLFYYTSEIDTYKEYSYPVYEYSNTSDSCYTYIRIGKDESNNHLLCKLIKNCNGDIMDISLDNFVTLIEK